MAASVDGICAFLFQLFSFSARFGCAARMELPNVEHVDTIIIKCLHTGLLRSAAGMRTTAIPDFAPKRIDRQNESSWKNWFISFVYCTRT